ncbi:MAG: glycerophosphodiester phosphodiesterase [Gammaproteobacteria bacterium]|nr:glycerophosphodiester phosphodiesterase [Gammaproteobacteria bacterium]
MNLSSPFASDPFIVIGHRGAAGLLPENTLPSFKEAHRYGARVFELDVYCVEGCLLVIHDDTVDRTTNGTGAVMSLPLSTLRALDAGGGAAIPTLEEVFDWLPDDSALNIELKGPGTGRPVAGLLRQQRSLLTERCMVSSFDHRALLRFREMEDMDRVLVAPLYHQWRDTWTEQVKRLQTLWLNLNHLLVSQKRINAIRSEGVQVLAYTVNTRARAEELQSMGVRGIFTDRPDLLASAS